MMKMAKRDWLACVPFPLGVLMVVSSFLLPIDGDGAFFIITIGVLLIIAGIITPSKIRAYIWVIIEAIL